MNQQQDQELIERYLSHALSASETLEFQSRLATDSALRAQVELQRHIHTELSDPKQIKLLETLQDVVKQPFASENTGAGKLNYRTVAVLLGLVGLGLIALIWVSLIPQKAEPQFPPSPVETLPPPQQTPSPIPETPQKTAPATEPIAALNPADFQPNRMLEPLAGTVMRGGGELEVSFTKPSKSLKINVVNKVASFSVAGLVGAETEPDAGALELQVFNNREADFKANKPVASYPLALSRAQEEHNFQFALKVSRQMPPGLYYLIVAEKGGNEPLAVQKLTVLPEKQAF